MDWKTITADLYKKIAPISGDLSTRIDAGFISRRKIETLWIEFDMNEFIYLDPFYGEQKSTDTFRMMVNPLDGAHNTTITHIQELENILIKDSRTLIKGAFSNSLDLSAPLIKFGKIKGDKIEFEMEYCLTNSDSYGNMTGTIDDHIQSSGRIIVDLQIKDMLLLVSKTKNEKQILAAMNPNIYNVEAAKEANDTGVTYQDYDLYRVPYKDIQYNLSKEKPWWKWN